MVHITELVLSDEQVSVVRSKIRERTLVTGTGCWEWQGARSPAGYGAMKVPGTRNVIRGTHRLAYLAWKGPYELGLVLDHETCDNPPCCNPDHLTPKTTWENTTRAVGNPFAQKAEATSCVKGHPFDEDNTYTHPQRGTRHCRQCKRERDRAALHREPEKDRHPGPRRGWKTKVPSAE